MIRQHPARPAAPALWLVLSLSGCSRSPSQDILGSFFPAWLLCAAIGIAVTAACHRVFGLLRLNDSLLLPPLTYLALAAGSTLAVWIVWFGG